MQPPQGISLAAMREKTKKRPRNPARVTFSQNQQDGAGDRQVETDIQCSLFAEAINPSIDIYYGNASIRS